MAVEFDDQPAAGSGSVVFDDEQPSFLSKTASNIIPDLKQTAEGLGGMVKEAAYDMPKRAIETGVEMASGTPYAETPSGQKDTELVQNAPEQAKAMARPITHPIDYFEEHPVQQTLNAAGALAGMGEMRAPELENVPPPPEVSPVVPPETPPPVIPMGEKGPTPEPASRMLPDPNAPPSPTPPPPKADPLQDVKDWMASKGQKFAQKPGIVQKIGNYLDEESAKLGGKDIGLQLGQVKSMGPGFQGLEKGKALVSYAREKGYLDPSLSDTSRRTMVEQNMNKAGEQLGALRDIADKRGAPPVEDMRNQLKTQLEDKFGIDAPGEVNKVLAKFDKAAKTPTFSKMAKLATDLHAEATPATKMGLHPGPTTEGANILARMNNDATRATFNTEEGKMFTDSLRDFGAHKKLEQALSAGGRKALVGRGAPGSATNRLIQEGLDRGGYRLGGNIASKVAGWTKANPKATLPQFFEELAHQSDQSVDEAIQGMSKGGVVPNDVKQWVSSRGC